MTAKGRTDISGSNIGKIEDFWLRNRREVLIGLGATALFSPSPLRARDSALSVPIRLQNNRLLMDCSFGNRTPMPFVIDSGGTLGLIREDLARSARLEVLGERELLLRAGRRAYTIYAASDFRFGGIIAQSTATFAGVSNIFPPEQAGSLAAGILTGLPAELGIGKGRWRIWPEGGPDRRGWTSYKEAIRDAEKPLGSPLLYSDIVINGQVTNVGLDTGMPNSNFLYRRAARKAGLWNAEKWAPGPPRGTGRVIRAPLELAGLSVPGALVTLVDQPEWREFENGILGLDILKAYDIATDPVRREVYLKPNGIPPSTHHYNRFGAWLKREEEGVSLGTVAPGSPAHSAGLRSRDRIIGIPFKQMLEQIYLDAGHTLSFTVDAGGQRREVSVTLADYL